MLHFPICYLYQGIVAFSYLFFLNITPAPLWARGSAPKLNALRLRSAPRVQYAWVQAAHLYPFFIFNGLEPNTRQRFFQEPTRVIRYFILIEYVLFCVKYNLKYHKSKITLQLLFSKKKKKIHEL